MLEQLGAQLTSKEARGALSAIAFSSHVGRPTTHQRYAFRTKSVQAIAKASGAELPQRQKLRSEVEARSETQTDQAERPSVRKLRARAPFRSATFQPLEHQLSKLPLQQ